MFDFEISGKLEILLAKATFSLSEAEKRLYRAINNRDLQGALAYYPSCRVEFQPYFYRELERLR